MQSTAPSRHGVPAGTVARAQVFTNDHDATWRVFEALPDLVNGDAATFSFIFVSAGLAAPYRWVPDATLAGMALPNTTGALRARICAEAAFHAHELQAAGMDIAKAKAFAVIVATARMAGRRAWGFDDNDTVATQRMAIDGPVVLAVDGALPADSTEYGAVAAWTTKMDAVGVVYDALKEDLLAKVQQVAIGMPTCNGAIIVRTLVHHYVEPHKAICDATMDQFIPADQVLPATVTMEELRDLLCHKAFHVIDSPRLVWMAREVAVRNRLMAVGQGAACVRLPAEFDVERAAGSMLALIQRIAGSGKAGNLDVTAQPAIDLVAAVKKTILDDPNQTGMAEARRLTEEFKASWGPDMAFGAGYLSQMFEFMDAPMRSRSVLAGYSVSKLQGELGEVWASGAEHYELARKYRKARAADGHLTGYGLMGAKKPDDFSPPDAAKPASN